MTPNELSRSDPISRRGFVKRAAVAAQALAYSRTSLPDTRPPNIVIVYADDMGYGDVGVYGGREFDTPNLDSMAGDGVRFTDFYVAQPVCSASRAALLTGCYSNRVGILGALGPKSRTGISDGEVTIAQLVKQKNYATAIFGKWHLGCQPQFLPLHHGFDEYFGLPYSNDMWPFHPEAPKDYPDLPLMEGDKAVAYNPPMDSLTSRYTERAVAFIEKNRERPFFLYLAHNMPHVPLGVSPRFKGKSRHGLYGDVIMEIDWSVGEILQTLRRLNLDENTLVIFASDNGPWLSYGDHSGHSGPLREGKGTTWEGGVRVPLLIKWPGRIPAGSTRNGVQSHEDLFVTLAAAAGLADLKSELLAGKQMGDTAYKVHLDGYNNLDYWTGKSDKSARREYFYYDETDLMAIRVDAWKMHIGVKPEGSWWDEKYYPSVPYVFNLLMDPMEKMDPQSHEWGYIGRKFFAQKMWAPAAASPFLGEHLKSLQDYPPRQGADSLSMKKVIEGAMKKMDSPAGGSN